MTATVKRRLDDTYLPLSVATDVLLVERLLQSRATDHDLGTIARVINDSRADLAGSPPGAMPELLERLVRQRLSDCAPSCGRDDHGGGARVSREW